MGDEKHEHDSHYHGEPSRVLDDEPLHERVILYRGGFEERNGNPTNDNSSGTPDHWLKQLESIKEIRTLLLAGGVDGEGKSADDISIHEYPAKKIEPLHPEFEGFPEEILNSESGILFIPRNLRIESGAWDDFRSNDVTVNWISLDPSIQSNEFPRVVLLSDWIREVSDDVPESRTTGVFPGIFSVRAESLNTFSQLFTGNQRLQDVFSQYLSDPGNKIRPAFLHQREWSY